MAGQMNKHSSMKNNGSLLERAGALYGFDNRLGGIAATPVAPAPQEPAADVAAPVRASVAASEPDPAFRVADPAPRVSGRRRTVMLDREWLRRNNFIVPDEPVTGLAEEFRLIKRQLLLAARGSKGFEKLPNGERILICSALPDEGKTFCAVNLALSLASEKDNRVLLVDADVAKPSVPEALGFTAGPGLMDAIANPDADVEDYIVETDVAGLTILPAGTPSHLDTEYLASARTERVIDRLTSSDPARIVIFDSPPALVASPASTLAFSVGQVLLVVKADSTTDGALRDAIKLLSGCEHIQLVLNGTRFSATGRHFGSYYGRGA